MSLVNKASIANLVSAFIIVAGVVSFFLGIESNDMIMILMGAGIGYLFKGVINGSSKAPPV